MKQRSDIDSDLLKKWKFEGSNDEYTWTKLDENSQDKSFSKLGSSKYFSCKRGIYQSFRLTELKGEILTVQRIEIYGIFCHTREICVHYLQRMYTRSQLILTKMLFICIILLI